jgi:hypothetical protein
MKFNPRPLPHNVKETKAMLTSGISFDEGR